MCFDRDDPAVTSVPAAPSFISYKTERWPSKPMRLNRTRAMTLPAVLADRVLTQSQDRHLRFAVSSSARAMHPTRLERVIYSSLSSRLKTFPNLADFQRVSMLEADQISSKVYLAQIFTKKPVPLTIDG